MTETEKLNKEFIASPEGLEALKTMLELTGWSRLSYNSGYEQFWGLKGIEKFAPPLDERLIPKAEAVLKKQWEKKTGNALRLFTEDIGSLSRARYMQIIDGKYRVGLCKVEPTELIARVKALLAVRELFAKEEK